MKLTQSELGTLLHRTKGAVSQWESGTTLPDFRALQVMAAKSGLAMPQALPEPDDGFGAEAVNLLRSHLGEAQRRLPKALLASMRVPGTDLNELAEFLVMLKGLLERYQEPI